MSCFLVGCVVASLALAGPPTLPPLPGQGPATDPEPSPPQRPAAPPPASGPAPQKPVAPPPAPDPAAPPADAREPPPPQAVPSPAQSEALEPELVEPPQPDPIAPPPEPPPEQAGEVSTRAPRVGGEPGPSEEEPGEAVVRRPPPQRPPHSGVGMFATAGVLFAIAIVEQSVAQFLVQRECVEPLVEDPITPEDLDQATFTCTPGVLPALILQAHAGLNIAAAIAMTAGGAALRAERDAWDDVFQTERQRPHAKYRGAGIGLAAGGFATWLTSSAVTWALLARCNGGNCVRRNRIAGFVARDIGFGMMAAGAGMLAYSEVYRRRRESNDRDRQTVVVPMAFTGGAGLVASGCF